jgi:Epoxide hydrolase N terminus
MTEGFTLNISDTDIADLHERLGRTRFPEQATGSAWAHGTDVGWMRGLTDYWRKLEGMNRSSLIFGLLAFGPYSRDRREFAQLVRLKLEYDGIFFGIGIFIWFRRTPDVEAGVAAKHCPNSCNGRSTSHRNGA